MITESHRGGIRPISGCSAPSRIVREDIASILDACAPELEGLASQTLLVTGGSGFVAAYLLESLAAWNASRPQPCRILLPVRSLERARRNLPHLAELPFVDWCEWPAGSSLRDIISIRADFVIHGASPADPAAYMDDPMATLLAIPELTRQVIDYAEASRTRRMLFLSSGAVYGTQSPDCAMLAESCRMGPDLGQTRSCYAEAKRYAELLCQASRVPTVVARIFAVLGPYQSLDASFAVPDFIRQAARSGRIRLYSDGRALRTFCYASDLAVSLWKLLLKADAGQSFNVGAASPVLSIRDVAEAVASRMGNATIEMPIPPGSGPPSRYIPDISRLEALHSPAVSFRVGLDRMLEFLREREPNPTLW